MNLLMNRAKEYEGEAVAISSVLITLNPHSFFFDRKPSYLLVLFFFTTFAGTPTTTLQSGTSSNTRAPAPIMTWIANGQRATPAIVADQLCARIDLNIIPNHNICPPKVTLWMIEQ